MDACTGDRAYLKARLKGNSCDSLLMKVCKCHVSYRATDYILYLEEEVHSHESLSMRHCALLIPAIPFLAHSAPTRTLNEAPQQHVVWAGTRSKVKTAPIT